MLTKINDIDVKRLAGIRDMESRDTFISVYLDRENFDKKFIEERSKACISALRDKIMRENFEKTMEWVHDSMEDVVYGEKGLIVFASYINNFFEEYRLSLPLKNLLVVDSSPYIKPIAELLDEYEPYGLVILNSHRARIYVVSSEKTEERSMSKDIMSKHHKGGWSQARFQRIRKGAIEHFLKDVAEAMEKIFSYEIKGIVIAGPGEAKIWLGNYLSHNIKEKIIDTMDASFEEEDIMERAEEMVEKEEKEEEERELEKLKKEVLKNGLAVIGIKETMRDVKNGMVETLLLSKGLKIKGWKCEKCQVFEVGEKEKCPYCGGRTTVVDVMEEVAEVAEKMDTEIKFIENDAFKNMGGMGGFLRYK